MRHSPLPVQASWQHHGVRDAFEVLLASSYGDGHLLRGATTGVEAGVAWSVAYDVDVDRRWRTRSARLRSRGQDGDRELLVERDELDRWSVDGVHDPALDGCVDVDLEASVVTNVLTLRRLARALEAGDAIDVPAAFVRLDLAVVRLEQTYAVGGHADAGGVVAYRAPVFDVDVQIAVDAAGLVTDYPGLAVRRT